jgi:hypothetical protein
MADLKQDRKLMTAVEQNCYLPDFFLGAEASCLHMPPDSPHSGHFFGLQRVSTTLPHFSQVNVAM